MVMDAFEEEEAMAFVGLAITFLGFLVSLGSLGISNSNTVRGVIVLVGIGVSLVGRTDCGSARLS